MTCATITNWIEHHSGLVTALSTCVLTALTAWYATSTFLLLRQERRLASEPRLAHALSVSDEQDLSLEIRNLGKGTASGVSLQAGPGRSVPLGLSIENLGRAIDLGPGERFFWPIERTHLPPENLRLTLSGRDTDEGWMWFSTFEVRFSASSADTSAGWQGRFSSRQLKRKIVTNIPMEDIPGFLHRHWRDGISELLVDEQSRRILSSALAEALERELALGERYEEVMAEI